QRKFHAKERAEHRNRVVAPQTSMTPDNVFRHAYDPTGHAGVAGILKFPLSPEFFSRRWMDVTGTVIPIATEAAFMTIVVLARVKGKIGMVLLDIGFECPVLSRSQTRGRAAFSKRNNLVLDEVLIVAGRMGIKFVFRDLFAVVPGHRPLLPMELKPAPTDTSGPFGKDLSSCGIVLRLQKDYGWAAFAHGSSSFI